MPFPADRFDTEPTVPLPSIGQTPPGPNASQGGIISQLGKPPVNNKLSPRPPMQKPGKRPPGKKRTLYIVAAIAGILIVVLAFVFIVPINRGPQQAGTLAQGITNLITHKQTETATPQTTQSSEQSQLPLGQSGNWKMIFSDNFDGSTLDQTKWTTCYTNADFKVGNNDCIHNNELELYRPENVFPKDGSLILQAQRQDVTVGGQSFHYTAGMISSDPTSVGNNGGFAFSYGYAEMRAKLPSGQGLWPAFWLLPQDGSWPPEIDVFEILGNSPNMDNMNYHYPNGNDGGDHTGTTWRGPDFSAGWHTYAIDWEPDSITWYIDGVARFHTSQHITSKPMYLLANLAVGGDWPGPPHASTPFPADYQIDYIHVWQHA